MAAFKANLELPDVDARRYVFAASGPAGVGKTFLLRRLKLLAESCGWLTVWTDESALDVPGVLNSTAKQLSGVEGGFTDFFARYKAYRAKRNEVEADPEAPHGFPELLGKTLARETLRLAKQVPIAGLFAEAVDENAAGTFVADAARYLHKKLSTKDDVQLVLSPTDVLTPLWVSEVNALTARRPIVFLFDTFERTGVFLDGWLRKVLEGGFGDVSSDVVVVVGGQAELDKNLWAPFEGIVTRWPVATFTTDEVRDFLSKRAIVDDRVVGTIAELSGGLPLLVATLASEHPSPIESQAGASADTAVKRFLKWVESPERRELALVAAVPRHFDFDVISILAPDHSVEGFEWLKTLPFVSQSERGLKYHDVVRSHIIRQLRHEAPGRLRQLHLKLRDLYSSRPSNGDVADAIYHSVCVDPKDALAKATERAIGAAAAKSEVSRELARAIVQAGRDTAESSVVDQGEGVLKAVEAFVSTEFHQASDALLPFAVNERLSPLSRAKVYFALGTLAQQLSLYEDAERMLASAVELAPDRSYYWRTLATTLLELSRPQAAIDACSKALELDPKAAYALMTRGRAYTALGDARAIPDFELATKLEPEYGHFCYQYSAELFEELGRLSKASECYKAAIVEERSCAKCWAALARVFRTLHPKASVRDLVVAAVPLDEDDLISRGARASGLMRFDFAYALSEVEQALEKNPKNADLLAWRAQAFQIRRDYASALLQLDASIEADATRSWVFRARASVRERVQDLAGAISDLQKASALSPSGMHYDLSLIGDLFRERSEFVKAAESYVKALQRMPACEHCWFGVAVSYAKAGLESSVVDLLEELPIPSVSSVWVRLTKGVGLVHAGFIDAGLSVLKAAMSGGGEPGELLSRSDSYTNICEYELALADVEQAIRSDPKDQGYYDNARGLLLSYLRRYDEALAAYRLSPPSIVTAYNIAVASVLRYGHAASVSEIGETLKLASEQEDSLGWRADYARAGLAAVIGDEVAAMEGLEKCLGLSLDCIKLVARDMAWSSYREGETLPRLVSKRLRGDSGDLAVRRLYRDC